MTRFWKPHIDNFPWISLLSVGLFIGPGYEGVIKFEFAFFPVDVAWKYCTTKGANFWESCSQKQVQLEWVGPWSSCLRQRNWGADEKEARRLNSWRDGVFKRQRTWSTRLFKGWVRTHVWELTGADCSKHLKKEYSNSQKSLTIKLAISRLVSSLWL